MIIQHNLMANFNQRILGINAKQKSQSMERLSSGYKINRAADNAAALTISEKMRAQIRGLTRAADNALDGISYVQVADGAINEMQAMGQRIRELCVQAANDTNVEADREAIQEEINSLTTEIDRICEQTEFNTIKIWHTPYVPNVTGTPREMKIWNDVDSNGNIIYGGILWGEDRFTWNEIDNGLYDSATNTFHAGEYQLSVPVVKFEPLTDTYVKTGDSTTLNLVVSEEGTTPPELYRECSWSANDSGIIMDGVLYEWSDLEDQNHLKTFDPSNIQPSKTYGFNTYNGTHVWFTIANDSEDLNDVINGINGDSLNDLSWKTKFVTDPTQTAITISMKDNITITESNKDNITTYYTIKADDTGVWMENANGTNLGTETWAQLNLEDSNGRFQPDHNITYHSYYNDGSTPDDHNDAAHTGGWEYTTGAGGYNSTVIPGIDFQFSVLQEAAKESVISGLNNARVSTTISTPSKITGNTGNTSGKLSYSSGSASLNFDFHKDFGRNFDDVSDTLGSASIDGSSTYFKLNISNGTTSDEFTSSQAVSTTRSTIENLLNNSGGSFSLNFSDGKGNRITTTYQVTALTTTEKTAIASGNKNLADFVDSVMNDLTSGTITAQANGAATQTYNGKANSAGNTGRYTNFTTEIVFNRKVMLQIGANSEQSMELKYRVLNRGALGLSGIDVSSYSSASGSLANVDQAMAILSEERSKFGAYQNRLEHVIAVNKNTAENLQSAESSLRDADMADEIIKFSKSNILEQAGISILAQVNKASEGILQLLQ